jgi:hypothetical protein
MTEIVPWLVLGFLGALLVWTVLQALFGNDDGDSHGT